MFSIEWWQAVHQQAPQNKEKIIYHMVEKILFGKSKEDNNIAYMPFLSLVNTPINASGTFDLSADKSRLESICMNYQISMDECLILVKEFDKFNLDRQVKHRSYAEAYTHFVRWIKYILSDNGTIREKNISLKANSTGQYKHFLSWIENVAPFCFAHMILPTEEQIKELSEKGISGERAGVIIKYIENNRAIRNTRKNLYIAIHEYQHIV